MWGTAYEYEGYIYRVHPSQLGSKYEELKQENERAWENLLVLMASTPSQQTTEDTGAWHEDLVSKYNEYRDIIENNCHQMAMIDNCLETLKEHPDKVKED